MTLYSELIFPVQLSGITSSLSYLLHRRICVDQDSRAVHSLGSFFSNDQGLELYSSPIIEHIVGSAFLIPSQMGHGEIFQESTEVSFTEI
jgi:hypothetical protein